MIITIYSPAGTSYMVTNRVIINDVGEIHLALEDELASFVTDDLSLTFKNDDGYFSSLWTLPLDPTLKYNESTGKGCWNIIISKNSTTRFVGDLDVTSVIFNDKEKYVKTTWFGKSKRAEVSAESIKRNIPNPLTFTCTKGKRILTFPNLISTYNFVVGDRIKCSQLKLNGQVIDQELEIKTIGSGSSGHPNQYEVQTRQRCKKAYTTGVVKDPFYKSISGDDLTVAECVALCFDALGIPSGKQVISGSGLTLKVDVFDTSDKSIAECLNDLAKYSGSVWFCDATKWYFIERNTYKAASYKNITALVSEAETQSTDDDWYDNVVVEGTPPAFAPNSAPRKARYGSGKTKTYKIETKYTSNLTTLKSIAQQVYNQVCKQRKKLTVKVLDDGTAYNIGDRIYYNNEYWQVIEVNEPLRGLEYKEYIELVLRSENGTLPSGTATDFDENNDDDAPYPPANVELGKGTDNPSSRPAWWSTARALYPNKNGEMPIKKIEQIIDDDDDPKTPPKVIVKRLWFIRWQNEETADDDPDGFVITVFDPTKGIDKPLQTHGYRNPKLNSDGYYYYPLYLACKTGAPEKYVVIQTYNDGKDLSAYSDEVSTYDWGGSVEDPNPFDDTTFTVTKVASDDYTLTFKLNFTSTSTGAAKIIPELSKIKVCKSEATATSPDLNRKQPLIDCLDYTTNPPVNTRSEFRVTIPHQKDVIPRVWFRPVAYDGQKMDWTYDSTSGGGGNASPLITQVRRYYSTSEGNRLEVSFTYSGITTGNKIKIWIQTNAVTGDPETGTGWAATCPNVINFANIQSSGGTWFAKPAYYNDSSSITATLPASAKIIMAVYDSSGTRLSNFSSVYDWVDLASTIPTPFCLTADLNFDDPNNKLIAQWNWGTAFTGYAYAVTYHQANADGLTSTPIVPSNGVLTPAQFEASAQYQINDAGKYFTLENFAETGHKYKTLSSATSLNVDHLVGTETATTLHATCGLILFLLDGSGKIIFGKYGRVQYNGSLYQTFPDFTLLWNTVAKKITMSWTPNSNIYYVPVQSRVTNSTFAWSNHSIGVVSPNVGTYVFSNASTLYDYRFRLALTNDYGGNSADSNHSEWKVISPPGGTLK